MYVAKINLVVPQGSDYKKSFDLTDDSGAPFDTTGCKFIFGARYSLDDEELTIEAECKATSTGTIQLVLQKSVTAKLKASNKETNKNILSYDILMIKGDESTRIMQGDMLVSPGHAYRANLLKDDG